MKPIEKMMLLLSANESVSQSVSQYISLSVRVSVSVSVSVLVSQSVSQSVYQSVSQSVGQLVSQSVSQSVSQPSTQSAYSVSHHTLYLQSSCLGKSSRHCVVRVDVGLWTVQFHILQYLIRFVCTSVREKEEMRAN